MIKQTTQLAHGGCLKAACAQYGGEAADWLDLSTGISPRSFPVPELQREVWSRLPQDEDVAALQRAASIAFGCNSTRQALGAPGTQILIELLPHLLPKGRVVLCPLGYQEHAHCWAKAGHEVLAVQDVISAAQDENICAQYVIVIHPHNPFGTYYDACDLLACKSALAARGGLLVVDEAFCDSRPEASMAGQVDEALCVLRSFGKFYGLAGLRLGFLLAGHKLRADMASILGPWAVSGAAIEIGKTAYENRVWRDAHVDWLRTSRAQLADVLKKAGLDILGECELFVSARTTKAHEVYETLAQNRILIRKFEQDEELLRFGLPKDTQEIEILQNVIERNRDKK